MTLTWQTGAAPPSGRWSTAWTPVPGSSNVPAGSRVTAVRRTPTHLDLFVAADGAVQSTWLADDGWQRWFPIRPATGKAPARAPITAVWRDAHHLDLFMSDVAGHVVSTYFDNDAWQPGWFPLAPATGIATPGAPVTALWRNHDHLDVFMTDVAGHVVSMCFDHDRWQPGWFALDPANLQTAPGQRVSAVWRDADHLDLFVVDAAGNVRSTYFEHDAWQRHWFSIGTVHATPGQPITALLRDAHHLDLFLTASNGRVISRYFEGDGPWREWFAI